MNCNSCGNTNAWHVVTCFEDGATQDICNACGLEGAGAGVPDVYLRRVGQTFNNLCDDMGRPIEIQSKRHKKEVMDDLGVSEAGGTFNGAPFGTKSWIDGSRDHRRKQFDKDRPAIRQTFREWKERNYGR